MATGEDKPKVLIVDDEPHIVNLVKLTLGTDDYDIIEAHTGFDALDKTYVHLPDVIILDLMIPGKSGYEVCKTIRENPLTKHIPVVILSAKTANEDKMKSTEVGADDYLTKPFDPAELQSCIKHYVADSVELEDLQVCQSETFVQSATSKIQDREVFNIYKLRLENFKQFCRQYGYRKGNDVKSIVARMLLQHHSGKQIGHHNHTYYILSQENLSFEDIEHEFENLIPFLYHEEPRPDKVDDRLTLKVTSYQNPSQREVQHLFTPAQ